MKKIDELMKMAQKLQSLPDFCKDDLNSDDPVKCVRAIRNALLAAAFAARNVGWTLSEILENKDECEIYGRHV